MLPESSSGPKHRNPYPKTQWRFWKNNKRTSEHSPRLLGQTIAEATRQRRRQGWTDPNDRRSTDEHESLLDLRCKITAVSDSKTGIGFLPGVPWRGSVWPCLFSSGQPIMWTLPNYCSVSKRDPETHCHSTQANALTCLRKLLTYNRPTPNAFLEAYGSAPLVCLTVKTDNLLETNCSWGRNYPSLSEETLSPLST